MNVRLFAGILFAMVILAGRLQGDDASAVGPGMIDVYPAKHASGGNIVDYGLHFDDGRGGAYDYAGTSNSWIRGMVASGMPYLTRYVYWQETSIACLVRARMQILDPYDMQTWLWVYDRDIEVLHLGNMPASTQATQSVKNPGDWFYKVVGNDAYCGTDQLHAHQSVVFSSVVTLAPKSDDTCWANGTECNVMGGVWVKRHLDGSTCPPGSWSGWAINRSGGVIQPYKCQDWSIRYRWDGTVAFRITF